MDKTKIPSHLAIFLILSIGYAILFSFLSWLPEQSTEPWPISIGVPTNEFDDLITKIENDLNMIPPGNIEIRILIGPYFRYGGFNGMLYYALRPMYLILFDVEFYHELTPEERKALVAHEAGHILFRPNFTLDRRSLTQAQIQADTFAARYVDPEHLISLLDKLYYDHVARKDHLGRINPN